MKTTMPSVERPGWTLLVLSCVNCHKEVERLTLAFDADTRGGYTVICNKCWEPIRASTVNITHGQEGT